MHRRFFVFSALAATALPSVTSSHPLGWVLRGLVAMGTRSAGRSAVGTAARSATRKGIYNGAAKSKAQAAARAVSSKVPYGARNRVSRSEALSILNSSLTVTSLFATVMSSSKARAMAESEKEDSATFATAIYYSLLQNASRDAQLAMWVDPPLKHFRGSGRGSQYHVNSIRSVHDDGRFAVTRVSVDAKAQGDTWRSYYLDINWVNTEYGWLITDMRSL